MRLFLAPKPLEADHEVVGEDPLKAHRCSARQVPDPVREILIRRLGVNNRRQQRRVPREPLGEEEVLRGAVDVGHHRETEPVHALMAAELGQTGRMVAAVGAPYSVNTSPGWRERSITWASKSGQMNGGS